MFELKCQFANHEEKKIITICLDKNCQQKRLCCWRCVSQFHGGHDDKLIEVEQFNHFMKNMSNQQSEAPEFYTYAQNQMIYGLENLCKLIARFSKIVQERLQEIKGQNLQEYIKGFDNMQQGYDSFNKSIEYILEYVEVCNGAIIQNKQHDSQLNQMESRSIQILKDSEQSLLNIIESFDVSTASRFNQIPIQLGFKQHLKETQDFVVKEDSLNFIGILFETLAVFSYFKDPQHLMCQIFRNRLITQINLSNRIYFQQQQNKEDIDTLKGEAADKILYVLEKTGLDKSEYFKDLIDHHIVQNLTNMKGINQIKVDLNQEPTKLGDVSVQKVINSMNYQDQLFSEKLTSEELQNWAELKFTNAFQQLENNFTLGVQKVEFNQIQSNLESNNIKNSINNTHNQQQAKVELQNQKEIYKYMQIIVQAWIDYDENKKNEFKLIYSDIPLNLWNNILNTFFNEESKYSAQIKFIIQSIQLYLDNQEIIFPMITTMVYFRLNEYNQRLKKLSQF